MKINFYAILFICSHCQTVFETTIQFSASSPFSQILAKWCFFNFPIFCSFPTFGGEYLDLHECNGSEFVPISSQGLWLHAMFFIRSEIIFEGGIFSLIFDFCHFLKKNVILVVIWVTWKGPQLVQTALHLVTGHIY